MVKPARWSTDRDSWSLGRSQETVPNLLMLVEKHPLSFGFDDISSPQVNFWKHLLRSTNLHWSPFKSIKMHGCCDINGNNKKAFAFMTIKFVPHKQMTIKMVVRCTKSVNETCGWDRYNFGIYICLNLILPLHYSY